ncbi:MAG: zinc-binding alcohol dehydrogenase family protein [Actinomycetales bacterium]
MRAAVIRTPGSPPDATEHPAPTSGPGQSLVDVTAAAITPLDLLCASGTSYFGAPATPYVPGVAGVGVVRASDVLAPGTRVWFATSAGMAPGDGSMAEHSVVPDADLVPLHGTAAGTAADAAVDDAVVAALGLSAVAAWNVLTLRARLAPGETVLVLGAGGVVGQVAIRAARLLGAGRVVGAARSAGHRERAVAIGADAAVALPSGPGSDDQAAVDEMAAAFEAACEGRADVVVDPLCGLPATAAARVLAVHGRLVNLGSTAGASAVWDSASLRSGTASILGYTNNDLSSEQRRDALLAVVGHAARGDIVVDHERVPLEDAATGWERQVSGTANGRVVLTV